MAGNALTSSTGWTQSSGAAITFGAAGAYGGGNTYQGVGYYTGTYPNDQTSQVVCPSSMYGGNHACGAVVRGAGTGTSLSAYIGEYNDSENAAVIYKTVSGGSLTELAIVTGQNPLNSGSNNAIVTLSVVGTSLTLYFNGGPVATATDSSLTSGNPGFFTGNLASYEAMTSWLAGGSTANPGQPFGWTDWVKFSPTRAMAAGGVAATGLVEANGFIDVSGGYLASAMSQQTTATCTNITGMTWPIQASKNYKLSCDIPITFAATATVQFCLAGPGSPTHTTLDDWGPIGAASIYFDGESIGTTSWGGKTTASGAPAATAVVTSRGKFRTDRLHRALTLRCKRQRTGPMASRCWQTHHAR